MPKLSTTVTQTVELTVEQRVQTMLVARCEEAVKLQAQARETKARLKRIEKEVEELLGKVEAAEALETGATIEGYKLKRVRGKSRKLDTMALMRAVGIDAEELDAFYDEKENTPYIRITAPGQKDDDE
jgi:hypothetical protein